MNAAVKDALLNEYQIRKGKKRKDAFITWMESFCKEREIPFSMDQSPKGNFTRNLVLGDLKTADTLVTAHYDTCAGIIVPNVLTPTRLDLYILYQVVVVLILFIPGVVLAAVLGLLFPNTILPRIGFAIAAWTMCMLIMVGPANKHTANDNTSGVASILTLAEKMTKEDWAHTALVLFDNEELGLVGSSAFAKRYPDMKKNTFVINLDCVSDGENMMLATGKKTKMLEKTKQFYTCLTQACGQYGKTPVQPAWCLYPSDQKSFEKGIAVSSMNKTKKGILYMDKIHTAKDTVFEESNIDCIVEAVARSLHAEKA